MVPRPDNMKGLNDWTGLSLVKFPLLLKELVGGFKYVLFSPLFGEDSHFDSYFSNGLKPPTRKARKGCYQISKVNNLSCGSM